MRLDGKVAIVTGAGFGFGEGIAKRFAAEGAKVLVADIDGDRAERVAGAIGAAARASRADVAKGPDFARMVEEALGAFGRLDVVVNNAGITYRNGPMLRGRRGDLRPRVRGQRQVDLLERDPRGAGVPPAGRRQHRQHRLDRGAAAAPGPDLVQRAPRGR